MKRLIGRKNMDSMHSIESYSCSCPCVGCGCACVCTIGATPRFGVNDNVGSDTRQSVSVNSSAHTMAGK